MKIHHKLVSVLLFTLSYGMVFSDTEPFAHVHDRLTTNLAGKWRYHMDIYDSMDLYRDKVPEKRWDIHEYNFPSADWLYVPGDWNTQRDELYTYEGILYYRTTFKYALPEERRLFLYFGAVNYRARVYLNGKPIVEHEGGFTPFQVELTGKLQDDSNSLVVEVDNTRRSDALPGIKSDWWNYGGITRDVLLVEVANTFIRDYHLRLAQGSTNQIMGWVQLDGEELEQEVLLEIPELNIKETIFPDASGFGEFSVVADELILWNPDDPRTYKVRFSTPDSKINDAVGFREIRVDGTEILLNGETIFLRGICLHEEAPYGGGRAWSREQARILLGWAKDLGCNFIRLAHYPHNEHTIRLADELGILLWEELPVYWGIEWENTETLQAAENQLRAMIGRDKNRASVIVWGMANETGNNPARNAFLSSLIGTTRELDGSRLISAALFAKRDKETKIVVVDDPLAEKLDIVAVNAYFGWYQGLPDSIDSLEWEIRPDKPFIFSETGAGALQGYHGDRLTRWSEEFQAWFYQESVEMFARIPQLRGTCPWLLVDFRSPRRLFPYIQDHYNRKGLISERGEKKQAYFVLRDYYQSLRQ